MTHQICKIKATKGRVPDHNLPRGVPEHKRYATCTKKVNSCNYAICKSIKG